MHYSPVDFDRAGVAHHRPAVLHLLSPATTTPVIARTGNALPNRFRFVLIPGVQSTEERIRYAGGVYPTLNHDHGLLWTGPYTFQRQWVHLKADRSRFGPVSRGSLTCIVRGWQFDLETGRYLISDQCALTAY